MGSSEGTGSTGTPPGNGAAPKRKRRMSKEGRARIIAATKARWERVRAEQPAAAKTQSAGRKTTAKKAAKKVAGKKTGPTAGPATAQTA